MALAAGGGGGGPSSAGGPGVWGGAGGAAWRPATPRGHGCWRRGSDDGGTLHGGPGGDGRRGAGARGSRPPPLPAAVRGRGRDGGGDAPPRGRGGHGADQGSPHLPAGGDLRFGDRGRLAGC